MDIDTGLSVRKAKVFRDGQEDRADMYVVTHAQGTRLVLEAPRAELQYDPLSPGDVAIVQSIRPDALYQMRARIVECLITTCVVLFVEQHGPVKRIQRRRFFRVPVMMSVKTAGLGVGPSRVMELLTENVSAGGLCLRHTKPLDVGRWLPVALDLRDGKPVIGSATRVIHCTPAGRERCCIGVRFLELPRHAQDRIVSVLMALMRKSINL